MAVVSADFATVVAACRRCLAHGTNLTGSEIRLIIDVVQSASADDDSGTIDDIDANDMVDGREA